MARAIAKKQNGRWIVVVDVDQYGGDELSCQQATNLANDIKRAVYEAQKGNSLEMLQ